VTAKRDSSWSNGSFEARHPTKPEHEFTLSMTELHMIQRVRQLEGGAHAVYLVKSERGKDGLMSFRVKENYNEGI
jgi:hypothetical protein